MENEYFQRQLDSLRREVELAKMGKGEQSQRARSLDRLSQEHPLNQHPLKETNTFSQSQLYEPQMSLPQPVPHPQPYLMMEDLASEPSQFKRVQGSPTRADTRRNNSRGSGAKKQPTRNASNSNTRRGRKGAPFGTSGLDENAGEPQGGASTFALEQEVKSLRFEL